jgi:hypothetical protein
MGLGLPGPVTESARAGLLGGVGAEQAMACEPTGSVLGQQAGAGQLTQRPERLGTWHPRQARGGRPADVRAGIHPKQPEQPCRGFTQQLIRPGEHGTHRSCLIAGFKRIQAVALVLQVRDDRGNHTSPARLVLHKSSSYTTAEMGGFRSAADKEHLHSLELLWIPGGEAIRLFRHGQHPPLRGTMLSLDDQRHLLYTHGSVPFYGTYPGLYIPVPLAFRTIDCESSPDQLAEELLALTKMNWNQTQLNTRKPITLETSKRVGDILRRLPADTQQQARHAFYM